MLILNENVNYNSATIFQEAEDLSNVLEAELSLDRLKKIIMNVKDNNSEIARQLDFAYTEILSCLEKTPTEDIYTVSDAEALKQVLDDLEGDCPDFTVYNCVNLNGEIEDAQILSADATIECFSDDVNLGDFEREEKEASLSLTMIDEFTGDAIKLINGMKVKFYYQFD